MADPSLSKSRLEALLAMGSGAVAEPLAGLAGLYGVATGGTDKGVRLIDKVRDNLTYQPRDTRGQQELAAALGPLARMLERGRSGLGDAAYGATGSPAAAAAAYTAPDALLSLLGYRPAVVGAERAVAAAGRGLDTAMSGPAYGRRAAQIGAIDYRGLHRAPSRDFGAPLDDVTGGGQMYPDDVYGPRGAQFYGHGDGPLDAETMRIIQRFRGNPDALVTIYRAVPRGAGKSINAGDWVTINRRYAEMHGDSNLNGDFDILEMQVPARDVFTNADSIHEWGYAPLEPAR